MLIMGRIDAVGDGERVRFEVLQTSCSPEASLAEQSHSSNNSPSHQNLKSSNPTVAPQKAEPIMADEDEDVSHLRAPDAADIDPTEETQDYRALDKLV
jgi:hypothetical protein